MGKTKRSKRRIALNSDPLNFNFRTFDAQSTTGYIEAIRNQLQNVSIDEKLNGLQSLAVLSCDKQKALEICASDIIRICGPFLCFKNLPVRNATAGALRNLSTASPEICEIMVEKDILTPLFTLLNEYIIDPEWKPSFDETMRNQMDIRSDIFFQSINLLWNLCESSDSALNVFNNADILERIITYLDINQYGMDITISIAQCILVISENNPKSWKILNNHISTFIQLLNTSGNFEHLFLRTIIAGIFGNVPALAADHNVLILSYLQETLKLNTSEIILNNIGQLELKESEIPLEIDMVESMDEETDIQSALRRRQQELPTEQDIKLRDIGYFLDSQRLASEIITNFICHDSDDLEDNEFGVELDKLNDVIDTMQDSDSLDVESRDSLPLDFIEGIKSLNLVELLWERSQALPDNHQEQLQSLNINLYRKIENLRISSLICLQNIFTVMNVDNLGGPDVIYKLWVRLGEQVFRGPINVCLLEPSTSLMRSALEHLKQNKDLFNHMSINDLELILNGVNTCSEPEIRANWLRMLGTLGCLLTENLVKSIITFIITTIKKEQDCWTISEALDALMDIFGDNDWNDIIRSLNLPEHIRDLDNKFKTMIRQQRRELKGRYSAVQTVRSNFSRFVVYIEQEAIK